jgi:hypothetical protein
LGQLRPQGLSPDSLCCFHGRAVAIEGKRRPGRLRQSQQLFRAAWEDAGGIYTVTLSRRRCPRRTARHGTQPVAPSFRPTPWTAATRHLAFFVARGLVCRGDALDVLQPNEFPIGSSVRCRITSELDDPAAHIARQAARAHAIIRARTREAIFSTKPLSFIKAEAERIQRDFDDALLPGAALFLARGSLPCF